MPKVTMEFDLPEEKEEFNLAYKGIDYSVALVRVHNELLRPHRKHGYGEPILDDENAYAIIERLEEKFFSILEDEEVSLY